MKRLVCKMVMALLIGTASLMVPAVGHGEANPSVSSKTVPPIGQQLVREGDFAVKLVAALNVSTTTDEAVAESRLSDVGISPLNGWIADYPMTPDIIGEVYKSVRDAAESGKIPLAINAALDRMNDVMTQEGLEVVANPTEANGEEAGPYPENKPSADVINNYYYNEGPPIVTYYSPPPDYYYLYTWVPYPFWWVDFWFPGYYILNDFHREVFVGTRNVFISNHFRDLRGRWYGRIDPVERFHGRNWLVRGNATRNALPSVFSRHDRGPGSALMPRGTVGRAISPSNPRYNPPSTGSRAWGAPLTNSRGAAMYRSPSRSVGPSISTPAYRPTPTYRSAPTPAYRESGISGLTRGGSVFRGSSSSRMGGTFSMPSRGGFGGATSIRGGGFSAGSRR